MRSWRSIRNVAIGLFLLSTAIGFAFPATAQQATPDPNTPSSIQDNFKIFLPLIDTRSWPDVSIEGSEVVQSIQNLSNSVGLVAGRPAMLRVYAKTIPPAPVNNVYLSISAYRNGSLLPGSPLRIGPKSLSTSWNRDDFNASFNVSLPTNWLSGQVTLTAKLDPDGNIHESNEINNNDSLLLNFQNIPQLEIMVVPINYHDNTFDETYPAAPFNYIQPAIQDIYPVSSVSILTHPTINFSGDLNSASEWERLLDRITELRETEGSPPGRVYYGVVPVVIRPSYQTWLFGRTAGISWVGYRAAAGLEYVPEFGIDGEKTVAHEIGHTFGRQHSPCNVSSADPNFPYPGGVIGQPGYSFRNAQFIPNTTADIMGYCKPAWISDYTYQALLLNQMQFTSTAAPQPMDSIYIRAKLDGSGFPTLEPVYRFNGVPTASIEASEYSVEFVDSFGNIIDTYPLPVLHAEEPEVSINAISAVLPAPRQPFSSLRLLFNGEIVTERNFIEKPAATDLKPSLTQTGDGLSLQWGNPESPALIRYSTEGGKTWFTLGVDILGGIQSLDSLSIAADLVMFEIIIADNAGKPLLLTIQNP